MREVNEQILLSEKNARLELVAGKTQSDKLSGIREENTLPKLSPACKNTLVNTLGTTRHSFTHLDDA